MDKNPLVSVIIVTYMQNSIVRECIDSVLNQNYPNIEIVVCDDCSADFEAEELEKYIYSHKGENIKKVVVFSQEKNVGTVRNANTGVKLSGGEYIKLIAGDDFLADANVLETIADYFNENKEAEIIAARSSACDHHGKKVGRIYPDDTFFERIKDESAEKQYELIATESWGAYVNAPAVAMRRRLYDSIGGFDEKYVYTEDWPTWMRLTKAGTRIYFVDFISTVYRYGGISNDMSGTNQSVGMIHYKECEDMLRNDALPVLVERGNRAAVEKCRDCIETLYSRYTLEYEWKWMTLLQRIRWNFKRKRDNNREIFRASDVFSCIKIALMVLVLLAFMYSDGLGVFVNMKGSRGIYIACIVQIIIIVLLAVLLIIKIAVRRSRKNAK